MSDTFAAMQRTLTSPAETHYAITPSDTADLSPVPRALYVSASGTAVLVDRSGTELSYDLTAGTTLPLRARRVKATGTTAQLIAWV
ncbi:hypothetical protein IV417_10310 [Alphaproteobacteria bacterium KMM 3653]|uniref:Uncharacterized protein n=1 Tax=Harenicola maris TaxID=2841044 RepID=A0AAP2CUA0_9RHOB|nr:hypothetical protein [Harenicola maris]